MPPKARADGENPKPKKSRRRVVPKDSPEYKLRRDRNNVAVRKSRSQTKEKAKETLARVSQLRTENEQLEQQVKLLAKELGVLKDLFKMSHPVDIDIASCAVNGTEAGIQTDDDVFGAQGMLDDVHVKLEQNWLIDEPGAPLPPADIEVNTRALQKDHEYVVKAER